MSVVLLMSLSALLSVYSARRAAGRIQTLVTDALERERLIGLLRLDAPLLIKAADDHINAVSDEDRLEAERAMNVNLKEIQEVTSRLSADLPKNEAQEWLRLSALSEDLVKRVAVTIKASNRKEAERARKHLEEECKPINFELDKRADALAERTTEDTKALLRELQELRLRTSNIGTGAVAAAVLLSLVVALQVVRTLRRQQEVIQAQMAEINARNQELDAFASRVAHDLVAPLSPLKGYLMLARRQSGDAQVKDLLNQAESSTSRMSELVDALLRFCRSGRVGENERGDLDIAVTTILLEQSQAAEAANVKLERSIETGVKVAVAPQLLQSIAQNVLSNAVKYSAGRPDAQVRVSVRTEPSLGVLEVSDNGPGISEESRARLFQPFFRAPETRQVPGTGLGLATIKRYIESHAGTIEVVTQANQGLTVTIKLPRVA